MLETARIGGDAGSLQECSSIGRAPVSKTGGRRFEPCHSCQPLTKLLNSLNFFWWDIKVGHLFVPALAKIHRVDRLFRQLLLTRRTSVNVRLRRRVPIK